MSRSDGQSSIDLSGISSMLLLQNTALRYASVVGAPGGKAPRRSYCGARCCCQLPWCEAGLLEAHWANLNIAETQGLPGRRLDSITNNGRSALAMASRTASVEIVALHAFKPVRA